jgi:hypothetical protein
MKHVMSGIELGLEWINTPAQLEKLKRFAASFGDGHKIGTTQFPYVAIKNRFTGEWKAYWQVHTQTPVAIASFHPDAKICSARDVLESMKILRSWAMMQHNGGFSAIPASNTHFTPELMSRMGMIDMNARMFEIDMEQKIL